MIFEFLILSGILQPISSCLNISRLLVMFGCFSFILLKYAHIKPFPISNPSQI